MASLREHNIQDQIRLYCGEHNILCFRCNVGKFRILDSRGNIRFFDTGLPSGFSDLIILTNNTIYFVEVKTLTGKQRDDQINFMNLIKSHGYKYIVARSVEDVINGIL